MIHDNKTAPRVRPLRRKRWPWIVGIFCSILAVVVGLLWWNETKADREINALVAQLDAMDPEWRLEARRKQIPHVPDEENSYLVAKQCLSKLGPSSLLLTHEKSAKLDAALYWKRPNHVLFMDDLEHLQTVLAATQESRELARRLADLRKCRVPLTINPDYFSTPIRHLEEIYSVQQILTYDAMGQLGAAHYDEMVRACLAKLRLLRALDDDPFLFSAVSQSHLRTHTILLIQFSLAQAELSSKNLKDLQDLLELETPEQRFREALRDEIAGTQHCFENWNRGLFNARSLMTTLALRSRYDPRLAFLDAWETDRLRKPAHALLLRHNVARLQASDRPFAEWQKLDTTLNNELSARQWPGFLGFLLSGYNPSHTNLFQSEFTNRARLRAAIIGLAAERYRLDQGDWPTKLDTIVPKYLSQLPDDPFVNAPFPYKRTADGVVIYSAGPDGNYDGGFHDQHHPPEGARNPHIEFRLWNVGSRRIPQR